ncbi:MAG: hypothetical protein FWG78_05095 [Coriobacteriia bacterium]|nr:hypothetical protein [Coriobacteriia bacterium]
MNEENEVVNAEHNEVENISEKAVEDSANDIAETVPETPNISQAGMLQTNNGKIFAVVIIAVILFLCCGLTSLGLVFGGVFFSRFSDDITKQIIDLNILDPDYDPDHICPNCRPELVFLEIGESVTLDGVTFSMSFGETGHKHDLMTTATITIANKSNVPFRMGVWHARDDDNRPIPYHKYALTDGSDRTPLTVEPGETIEFYIGFLDKNNNFVDFWTLWMEFREPLGGHEGVVWW